MLALIFSLLISPAQDKGGVKAAPSMDTPHLCESCTAWNETTQAFRVHGNTYYVGPKGVSAVAIRTKAGVVLLDGGLPQSAPKIEAGLREVGLDIKDVKFILNSHAHYDHAGGIARLQHDSGATVVASVKGAEALISGRPTPDDPQYGADGSEGLFPAVKDVRVVKDGEVLRLGDVEITTHLTPGHTPGSATWSWKSCVDGSCVNVVYADSLNAVALDGFRFLGPGGKDDRSDSFRASIAKVGKLPCDVLITVHADPKLFERARAASTATGANPFVEQRACEVYAAGAARRFEERVRGERAGTVK
jgi:metallo-beta-lactamase class B